MIQYINENESKSYLQMYSLRIIMSPISSIYLFVRYIMGMIIEERGIYNGC